MLSGTHPVLHQSTPLLCPLLSMISGAMYSIVPMKLLLRSLSPETLPYRVNSRDMCEPLGVDTKLWE